MQIHYSIQPNVQGRPAKGKSDTTNPLHYKQGFVHQFTTVEEFAKAVAEDGYLWSGTTFKNGVRTGGNFQLADTFSLDFDNQGVPKPTTVDDVLRNHPLRDGIALIYHSGSSTKDCPRFRVVFRLDKPIRDRRDYRLFCHRLHAVSADIFDGLDNTNDEARIWYGNTKGAAHINSAAAVDLDQLARLFGDLDEDVQRNADNAAIRRVATRSELVKLGLMKEKDAFAGDPETDIAVFKLCLQHLPQWEGNGSGWYADNSWILGAAVESFGVDVAAEVLECVWGAWPRSRHLYEELQQWELSHGNPAGFGSVVSAAQAAPTWNDDCQDKLDELQKSGLQKASFFETHQDVISLDSVREAFGCKPVTTASELESVLSKLNTGEKLIAVDAAITEMLAQNVKRAHRTAKARAINSFYGQPYSVAEIPLVVKRLQAEKDATCLKGAKPLHGLAAILQAVEEDDEVGGYIVDRFIPAGAFTIVGGAPKVGKTSLITAACVRALLNEEGAEGLETIPVSHLTIFSDDQKATVTGSFVRAAINGSGIPQEECLKRIGNRLHIYPSLTLDEDGTELLSTLAGKSPGGIFVIDSLASTASRLGIDENSAEIGGVIQTLRTSIQKVDPTATVLLIHHVAKGGSNNRSATDAFRGSSAITGAVDNQMLIERPTEKRNGNSVDQDLTDDRLIHLRGRSIGETKIVVNGQFEYPKGRLDKAVLKYVGTSDEYKEQQQKAESLKEAKITTRGEVLSESAFDLYNFIGRKREGVEQKHMPGNRGTVSKAIKALTEAPALIVKDEATGKWKRHPDYSDRFTSPYHVLDN